MARISAPAVGETLADGLHDCGLGNVQQVVVAALVLQQVEPGAIIGALQPLGLDQGTIGAVLDQDALGGLGAKGVGSAHFARAPSRWQMA